MTTRGRLGLLVLLVLAASTLSARGFGVDSMTERGLRLLAAARAHDLGSEAPAWTVAMSLGGTRAALLFELLALATSYRVLRALGVSVATSVVVLLPLALDRHVQAHVASGEPVAAAMFGCVLLVALHTCRAGGFAVVGRSPWLTALVAVCATLLSFELSFVALLVVIARHPTRRIALVAFVLGMFVTRLALGELVPAPIAAEAAFLARLPAVWGVSDRSRFLPALRETWEISSNLGSALPIAIGSAFFVVAALTRRRACAQALRLVAPLLGATVGLLVFARFTAPSPARWVPLVTLLLFLAAIGLDRARSGGRALALAFTVVIVASTSLVSAPARAAHATVSVAGPVMCSPCGHAWLARSDLLPLATLDADGRAALREGALFAYGRARGVISIAVEPALFSDALFGPRLREQLRDALGAHTVGKVEDDALTLPARARGVHDPTFAPHFGDGFQTSSEGAESRGARAEVVFVPPPKVARARLQLAMRSAVDAPVPVDVTLDGVAIGRIVAEPNARWFDVPLAGAKGGRSRLRLSFPSARRLASPRPDAWRTVEGLVTVAVVVERLRLLTGDEPSLSPEGPLLDERTLRHGFLPIERDAQPPGVWATGTAQIAFFVMSPERARILDVEAGPPPGGDQTVTVRLGTKTLGVFSFPASSISRRTLPLPPDALVEGENVLVLSFSRIEQARALYLRSIVVRSEASGP